MTLIKVAVPALTNNFVLLVLQVSFIHYRLLVTVKWIVLLLRQVSKSFLTSFIFLYV